MTELLPGVDTPSDAELISRVRGGDLAAYGELFSRHVEAARRLARQLMRGPDVDDLVSDAFAKTLNVIQGGGGPDVAFRAYLLTSVRRLHVDRIRASKKVQPSDDMTLYDDGLPFQDTVVASFENGAAAKAFSSLPERWQLVLWHLEVEGQKPADIAPLLGMTPNSVSALAYRAREGLRQAFLTMHLADCATEQCRWVNDHLGAYVRKGLSRRDRAKVEEHFQDCRRCTATYLELTEVNSNLAAIIGPLVLGAAAAAYVSSASGVGITGVSALVGRIRDVVTAHGGGSGAAGSTGATAAGGATAGTAAGGATAATAAGGAVATGSAVTAGGALTAGGVIAAGVAAVTTAALVFGGTPKEHITDADRSVGTVQTPAAAGAAAGASRGNAKQRTTAAGRSSTAATPGASPSASEVVVVAKAPEGTAPDAGNASDNTTAPQATDNPAQQGGRNAPASVAPTIDLPGPLPGVPVPPISVPTSPGQSVPAPQPSTDGSQPSDSTPPTQQAGASDGGSQDGAAAGSTSGGTTDGTQNGGTQSGTTAGGTTGGTTGGGTQNGGADDHSPKGDTSHGNDGPTAAAQGSSGTAPTTTESAQPTGEPAQQPAQPAGQSQTQAPTPTDQPPTTQEAQQLPAQDATAQSTPDRTAPPQRQAAPTPLTIHDVRMTKDNLVFQITGHGELPRDVTVTVAEGTHGVAFVPDGARSTTSDSAVRDGDTLHVTIPLVLSVLPVDARLFFTVSAADGFTFVDSSGQDLQGAVQPTYDITATQPGASADQPSGTPSSEPAKATIDLTSSVPAHVIVDQSGRGQVTVTVHGVDEATLLAKPTPFRLVPADSSAATPYAQVTGVVPGATPGTLDVTFSIPPGHVDESTQWRLQIGEYGPMTEPFELDVVPAYGSGGNGVGPQEQHRSPIGAGQFAADLGVRGLGNGS